LLQFPTRFAMAAGCVRLCKACRKSFASGKSRRVHCSPQCRARRELVRYHARRAGLKLCSGCRDYFRATRAGHTFCSTKCRTVSHYRENQATYIEAARAYANEHRQKVLACLRARWVARKDELNAKRRGHWRRNADAINARRRRMRRAQKSAKSSRS